MHSVRPLIALSGTWLQSFGHSRGEFYTTIDRPNGCAKEENLFVLLIEQIIDAAEYLHLLVDIIGGGHMVIPFIGQAVPSSTSSAPPAAAERSGSGYTVPLI